MILILIIITNTIALIITISTHAILVMTLQFAYHFSTFAGAYLMFVILAVGEHNLRLEDVTGTIIRTRTLALITNSVQTQIFARVLCTAEGAFFLSVNVAMS